MPRDSDLCKDAAAAGFVCVVRWLGRVCGNIALRIDQAAAVAESNMAGRFFCARTLKRAQACLKKAPRLAPTLQLLCVDVSLSEVGQSAGLEPEFYGLVDQVFEWDRLEALRLSFPWLLCNRVLPKLTDFQVNLSSPYDEWRTVDETEALLSTINKQLKRCIGANQLLSLVVMGPRVTLRPTYGAPLELLHLACDLSVYDLNLATVDDERGVRPSLAADFEEGPLCGGINVSASPLPQFGDSVYTNVCIDLSGFQGIVSLNVGYHVTVYDWPQDWLVHLLVCSVLDGADMAEWCKGHLGATFRDFCNVARQVEHRRVMGGLPERPLPEGSRAMSHREARLLMLDAHTRRDAVARDGEPDMVDLGNAEAEPPRGLNQRRDPLLRVPTCPDVMMGITGFNTVNGLVHQANVLGYCFFGIPHWTPAVFIAFGDDDVTLAPTLLGQMRGLKAWAERLEDLPEADEKRLIAVPATRVRHMFLALAIGGDAPPACVPWWTRPASAAALLSGAL